ncbi:MAG: PAS domain S-box protein, partial [Dehalococcoidia bacterium]
MNQSARILVADDDPDILDGTARLLERAGYVVDRASSGEEALQVVQNHHPDLLLLDHDMPGIDGIEVCRRIKRDPTMVDSLVVIVSASHTDSDEQASGLESGADGYIGRPIANRELLARVRAFVRIQNLTFSMREQTRQLEERNENLRQERLAALNLMEDAAEARERTEKANQALRESEETLRTHIENSFDVIFTLNKEGKFLFVSPAWERHFGYPTSDVIGKSFAPCVHPDDIAPLAKYLERVLSSGKGETSPSYRVKHADGSWRWIVCNGTPYVDTKGELRFIGVGRDITDAKRAEEVLRESEVRYKALFTGTAEGIVVADLETKQFRYANPSMCRMFGYTEEEFVRLGVAGIHPKESLCYVQAEFAAQARGEKTFTKDLPCLRKDGVTFYANVNAALIVLDDRKCLVGFFTDTTENKKAEEALRESEELLSEMTTQVPGVVYQFYARPNGEMGFYYVSDRSERVLGLKPDLKEYLERFVALVIPEHREGFVTSIKKSVNESTEWKYEGMLQKPTGENICFFGNSNPSPRENEMVFNGIVLDITERKRMERTLADNEEKIHLLLDSTAEAIYGLDMSGNCTFCNSSCLHLLGYKHPDELLGKNMHWLIHSKRPDGTPFPAEGCRIFKAFKKGEGTHVDDEVLWRSDGTSFPAEYWSYPQRHDGVV